MSGVEIREKYALWVVLPDDTNYDTLLALEHFIDAVMGSRSRPNQVSHDLMTEWGRQHFQDCMIYVAEAFA